ncbi:class I SAM-dependent methyltransferase [endosymbiont 'TC1' of Trimyema compressum]|uniref:class I SAM-dependent methyltransferase n=1 Tax=endosymbiont 'TC1' of Trimyema compressum TaxID=243899 RepID=UPI0013922879|nr:class I SAM-dependent methyltransferase [endosymbiont 'TC1' of Trimyema compressum]
MKELLDDLEISNNDRFLEVSAETGHNLKYLVKKYQNLELYGLDISSGMLKQYQKILTSNQFFSPS